MRAPLPPAPGSVAKHDAVHVRNGTANLFTFTEPLAGWRQVTVTDRLEIHHMPKHGSWTNMAERELSVLGRQCFDRRIADRPTLARKVATWNAGRNAAGSGVDWQFTAADARVKLKRLYPVPVLNSRLADH